MVSNFFPPNESWRDFLKKLETMDPIKDKNVWNDLVELARTEAAKDYPDAKIVAGTMLILQKAGATQIDFGSSILHAIHQGLQRYSPFSTLKNPPLRCKSEEPDDSSRVIGDYAGIP